ncbi:hypothetical protein FACS18949_03570 [Clostridia bacterium]|nr:hypothetical protein FACS18949_03570 [Clostridia bacterium]
MKKNPFIIWYSIILFACAALIIGLSYAYSQRTSELNSAENEKTHQLSLTALQTIENMTDDLLRLTDELSDAKLEIEKLGGQLKDADIKTSIDKSEIAELRTRVDILVADLREAHETIAALTAALETEEPEGEDE